jgi:hypothetical protein
MGKFSCETLYICPPLQVSTLQLPSDRKSKREHLSLQHGKISRTKSLKMKILGSNEELEASGAVNLFPSSFEHNPVPPPVAAAAVPTLQTQQSLTTTKTNIREKLRKFFLRRPTMDDLFKKGIIRNEPVFGSTLGELEISDCIEVPLFVSKCIVEIEKGDFLRTDGVYRQSGNLSTVQKIRLQVDQGNLLVLENVDDVHVLTGALKLFFRELKEPLIPWDCVDRLIKATCSSSSSNNSKKVKVRTIKDILGSMSSAHRATLAALLRHLIKVTEMKEYNRMQIPNLAIVFGPTLMWPPTTNSVTMSQHNLALDMMQQNVIVESLLNHAHHLF